MKGCATYGERVVIVEVDSGHVQIKTGSIASRESSHVQADNRNRTVVWGDTQFRPVMEASEDAYEKLFQVDDIHLLKEQEVRSLRTRNAVQRWFGEIYQDALVEEIQRALKQFQRKQA